MHARVYTQRQAGGRRTTRLNVYRYTFRVRPRGEERTFPQGEISFSNLPGPLHIRYALARPGDMCKTRYCADATGALEKCTTRALLLSYCIYCSFFLLFLYTVIPGPVRTTFESVTNFRALPTNLFSGLGEFIVQLRELFCEFFHSRSALLLPRRVWNFECVKNWSLFLLRNVREFLSVVYAIVCCSAIGYSYSSALAAMRSDSPPAHNVRR